MWLPSSRVITLLRAVHKFSSTNHLSLNSKLRRVFHLCSYDGQDLPIEVTASNRDFRIAFLGTPAVAAHSLQLLYDYSVLNRQHPSNDSTLSSSARAINYEIALVVSQPPSLAGRNKKLTLSPVHELATKLGLPLLTPDSAKDSEFLDQLEQADIDLCITAAYGNFLPKRFLSIPRCGTVNIHPSLLPRYRGAAPVQRCLENGDSTTGVSIVFTVSKMDAGPIIRQITYPLKGDEKAPQVLMDCFDAGTKSLIELFPRILTGDIRYNATSGTGANVIYQIEEDATPAPKLNSSDATIDFGTMNASQIHNRCRGYSEWPGIAASFIIGADATELSRIKIITTHVLPQMPSLVSKEGDLRDIKVVKHNKVDMLQVTCHDGSLLGETAASIYIHIHQRHDPHSLMCLMPCYYQLGISQLQPANKKIMGVRDFVNGLRGDVTMRW